MKIKKLIVGLFQSNCYLAWDDVAKTAVVIDPGGSAGKILESIRELDLRVAAVILTHGHRDHTGAAKNVRKRTGAPLFRFPGEPRAIHFSREIKSDGKSVIDLADGARLDFGPLSFTVIHTPGHSPASVCLYSDGGPFGSGDVHTLFTGDLLFQGGVGRFDLKGGSFRELVKSLNVRIAHLPDETDVLPGHGPVTTLGRERKTNPFFRQARDRKSLLLGE